MKKVLDVKEFLEMTVEEIFADRFSRYSKYIIQDRALPDIRDGLKPVQRRIIYSMFKEGNVFDKQFRKSAKTVGNVIGNYHPHGDSSVYEAMVRMSQTWKNNEIIVMIHGNNGSIDGDSPAAMRYTEAKLSQYANLMITDINEETVDMALNFDDTEYEPVVLPTMVPNLLINGATGISSGYATDIPPHNPAEVINAAIYVNEHKNVTVDKIMKLMPGPDFPTGATIEGIDGIKEAYTTGKGKIVLRARYSINKNKITITEIPYDVNKAQLLQKIDLIRIEKKVDGIDEVIDESDQNGLEISINLKSGAKAEAILNYLFKNTDLQKNYNFNMISINKHKPELLGIIPMLQAFLDHRFDVITKRCNFRLDKAKKKLHILEGLTLAVENLDEVIRIIRSSDNKAESKENLILAFNITQEQAEAIVMMQLYRLSNTDLVELANNKKELEDTIKALETILSSDENIKKEISKELKQTLKLLSTPRRSVIEQEVKTIEFNQEDLIKEEECIVSITKQGYIKRSSMRSYLSSNGIVNCNEHDSVKYVIKATTKQKLVIFLNDGTYCIIPIHELDDIKYKDSGVHIASIAKLNDGVNVVGAININQFSDYEFIYGLTNQGYLAKFNFSDLDSTKSKQKIQMQKLKKDDFVVDTCVSTNDFSSLLSNNLLITTTANRYLNLEASSFEVQNLKTVGRKVAKYKTNEVSFSLNYFDQEVLAISSDSCYIKLSNITTKPTDKLTNLYQPLTTRKQEIIKVVKLTTPQVLWTYNNETEVIDVDKLALMTPEDKLKSISKNETLNVEPSYL